MNTQGIKNILIGATPNGKIVRGATYAASAGVAGGFLATKGVIALTAGSALALAGGWALLAVAVGGVALAILGAIQAYRGRGRQEEGLAANNKLDLQWTEDAKTQKFKRKLNAKLFEPQQSQIPVLQGLNPNIVSVLRICKTSTQAS